MPDFNFMRELNIGLLAFSSLVTLFLYLGTVTDYKRKRPFMRHFSYLLLTNIIMQVGEMGICIFDGSGRRGVLTLCFFLSYGGGAVLISIYIYCLTSFIKENARVTYRLAHIVCAVCAIYFILILSSPFTGAIFTIDAGGYYRDGTLKAVSYLFDPIAMVVVVILILCYRKSLKIKGILYLVSISVLSIPTMILWEVWYPVPEYIMVTLYFMLVFILFHGELTTQPVKKEKEMAESKITTAMSQIQPHIGSAIALVLGKKRKKTAWLVLSVCAVSNLLLAVVGSCYLDWIFAIIAILIMFMIAGFLYKGKDEDKVKEA